MQGLWEPGLPACLLGPPVWWVLVEAQGTGQPAWRAWPFLKHLESLSVQHGAEVAPSLLQGSQQGWLEWGV